MSDGHGQEERTRLLAADPEQPPEAASLPGVTPDSSPRPTVRARLVTAHEPAPVQGAVPAPGSTVAGRYTVLDLLGQGGMGTVVAAYDARLDRRVALKLLHSMPSEGGSGALEARLLREAQAMARLSHPNVVAAYDTGSLEDGSIFIAMEYVEGQTLRGWCQEKPRTWREVLEAYLAAGSGLAAAHAVGLIHRDFKPDNVLVGRDGRVRVTDFGVARAESSDTPDASPMPLSSLPEVWDKPLTLPGMVVGTPKYIAPELLRGQPADVRSDLFSFCLALYESLYGQPAFPGRTSAERMRARLEGRVSPPPSQSGVPGWVARTVLRGLRATPQERPGSMGALLEMLRSDPAVRRQERLRVAGRAAVAGVVTVLCLALGWQYQQQRQLACAGMEQRLAGIWDGALRDQVRQALLDTRLPYAQDTAERVVAALDGYAGTWVRMRTEVCEASRQAQQPGALAVLQVQCLERRRGQMGALTEVLSGGPDPKLLPKAVQAALSLPPLAYCEDARALTADVPPPEDPAVREKVEALQARVDRLEALDLAGRYTEALALGEPLLPEVAALDYPPLRARALYQVALLRERKADFKGAEALLREALPLAAQGKDDTQAALAASRLLWLVGIKQSRSQEAVLLESLVRATVERADSELVRIRLLHSVGSLRMEMGQYEEARELLERALAMSQRVLGPRHLFVTHLLNTLANLMVDMGRFEESLAPYERVLELRQQLLGPVHPEVALSLSNLGSTLRMAGHYDQARERLEHALAVSEKVHGPEHPEVAHTVNSLGNLLLEMGQFEEARVRFEHALSLRRKSLGPEHMDVSFSLEGLGNALLLLGRLEEARALQQRSLDIRRKAVGPAHMLVGFSLSNLGQVHAAQGRYREARALHARALALLQKAVEPSHPIFLFTLGNLGRALVHLGELDTAGRHLERALELLEKSLGREHPMVADVLLALGEWHLARGQPAEALPRLERALVLARPTVRAEVQFTLAEALRRSGVDSQRARALAAEAQAHYRRLGNSSMLARVSRGLATRARR
ncbi:MAG TPA: serine/threonine-protein kinase [Archangium sp.]|uniref:serine/threonine-protein kinase n=1 Tax=Archangium sp. TaxID=1872627 RepID=UPI002E3701BC|nr:serine/threonine-protein kinase [Archangium sp.]HEX5748874.1 serine/threonine-protein kinase [Archangium sp.]